MASGAAPGSATALTPGNISIGEISIRGGESPRSGPRPDPARLAAAAGGDQAQPAAAAPGRHSAQPLGGVRAIQTNTPRSALPGRAGRPRSPPPADRHRHRVRPGGEIAGGEGPGPPRPPRGPGHGHARRARPPGTQPAAQDGVPGGPAPPPRRGPSPGPGGRRRGPGAAGRGGPVRSLRRVLGGTFGSLAIRNYRLYFASMLVSMTGSWMQRLGQSWLVLHLTGNGLDLGVVNALQFLPMLLFGVWGGVIADRADKRRLIMVTQSLMGGLAAVLGVLTLAGAVHLWMVDLLALALGVVTAVDTPTRQAFVPELVDRGQVSNAVSLNSAVFTSSRIIGPAAAGIVITLVGMGWCFLLNAISFAAVIAALIAMDPHGLQRRSDTGRRPGQLAEGLRYTWSHPGLRLPLFLLAMTGTFALNWSVTLPLLAQGTFHGDANTYGLLFSMLGLGSLAGALFTAGRRRPSDRLLLTSLIGFGVLMLGAAVAPDLRAEIAILIPLGVAAIVFQTTANSLLQLRSDPALRGRVMAIYSVVFLGTTPIGAPIVGWVAQLLGARAGVALGGVAILAAVLTALPAWRGGAESRVEPSVSPGQARPSDA